MKNRISFSVVLLSSFVSIALPLRAEEPIDGLHVVPRSPTSSEPKLSQTPPTLSSVAQANCIPAPQGLVQWWPGETCSIAIDLAGDSHGCLRGNIGFATGLVGNAFNLDGVSGYVDLGDSPSLRLTSSFTLEAWINPSMDRNGFACAILTKWGQSANGRDSYGLYLYGQGTTFQLLGAVGDGVTGDNGVLGGNVPPHQWSHVAMSYDSTTGANILFVNGNIVASRVRLGGPFSTKTKVFIGREDSASPRPFPGLIDEPSLYARALTPSEVRSIYEAGSAGKCYPGSTEPRLRWARCEEFSVLLWPVGAQGYVLQESSSLTPSVRWTSHTELPIVVGDQNTITLPSNVGTHFFQLIKE